MHSPELFIAAMVATKTFLFARVKAMKLAPRLPFAVRFSSRQWLKARDRCPLIDTERLAFEDTPFHPSKGLS